MPHDRRRAADVYRQIREDWEAHGRDSTLPGFRALAVHRFGRWVRENRHPRPVGGILRRLHRMMYRYVRNHYGIELPVATRVGRRVVIAHQGGIVIHDNAVIGDDCCIRQNVTIGAATFERIDEAPTLGRSVEVGCGAVILGSVTMGDGARIGPNAVVMTDVPAGASVFVSAPRVLPMMRPQGQRPQEVSRAAGGAN